MLVAKIMCVYSTINVFLKYNKAINYKDNNAVIELGLQRFEKY